ncbi:hypothetical protein NAEGRDRAFT_59725 [Naegleria gruberi]|uniref:RNI-like protein n=1 Tax=Naegleria gruberi TaxID=5762 RepID=D2VZY1_NAEGR|nr:uncharacterized protein NAEGRDRAFT_59725 [Naegleria gruberi]EFC37612.1 hypothetical protein NAEGRDRAFT_59725 [Naegleria gruberi]|eukprot:XP_002670356.1 hypothetical protein NAEGRDRAFT_59725 [Naegleria gruberi strain NEG-M]
MQPNRNEPQPIPPFSESYSYDLGPLPQYQLEPTLSDFNNNQNITNDNSTNSTNSTRTKKTRQFRRDRDTQISTPPTSSSSSSLNNINNNNNSRNLEKNNSSSSNNNNNNMVSVAPGISIIPGNQHLINNNANSLPERIEGGATKCPICTRNKQSCEEAKSLMGKLGVSNPFLKAQNDAFNKKVTRHKGKIKMKEFNASIREEFKQLLGKIEGKIFRNEEEYSTFLKREYYDHLNEYLKETVNSNEDDEEYHSNEDDEEDVSEISTEEDEGSDTETSDEDEEYPKKRKSKASTPSSKKSKADKSTAKASSSTTNVASSSSFASVAPLGEAKVELVAYQEKYKDLNIYMLCILNLSDFDNFDKFKSAIKKELLITHDNFKIYFKFGILGKSFIITNSKILENLKQQNILVNFSNHLQSRTDLPSTIDCNLLEEVELIKCDGIDEIFEKLEKITKEYCEKELKIYGSTVEKSFRNCIPLNSLTFKFCSDVGDKACVSSSKLFKNLNKLWFDKNKKPTELTFGVAPQSGFTGILHENNGLVSVLYQFRDSLRSLKLSEFLFHTSTTPEDTPYNFTKVLSLLTNLKDIQLDLGSTNTSVSTQSVFLAQNMFEISNSVERIVLNECGDILTQEFWDVMTGNNVKDETTIFYPNLHTLTVHSGKMYNITSSLIRENAFPKLENVTFDYCCRIESLYKDAKESSTSTFEQNEEVITTNKKQFKNITFDRCIRLKQGMNQFISMCNPKLIDTFDFLQMKECTRYDWLGKLTSVKHVNLTSNINLKDDDLKYLANCEQLVSLSLAHNKTLNGSGLKYLADSTRICETLQFLNVDWCSKFEDQALEHISKFTNLRQLHILHVKILSRFDLLKSLTKLETLLLVRCFNLSDESIIPVIENCKDLKVLSLHGGHHGYNEAMSNKILKAISQNLHNIRHLTVNFAPITNDGVKLLAKLHYLEYLDVMRSKASDKILKYFPNTSVVLDIKQISQ